MRGRPNILFVTSDQHHFSCLGSVNRRLRTPVLDRLAAEGTRFDRAYTPSPVCTPSRASMITGRYPSEHGAWNIGTKLPEHVPTVGRWLADAGYATSLIGKAHFQPLGSSADQPSIESYPILHDLPYWRSFHGPYYGFDHVELCRNHADEPHAGQHYALWMQDQGLADWRRYFLPAHPVDRQYGAWDLPARYHYNTWIAERTIARIDHSVTAGQPFFIWASFPDPHPPYLVPEPWASMYEPAEMVVGSVTPGEHDRMPPYLALTQREDGEFAPYRDDPHDIGLHSHRHDRDRLRRDQALYYGMVSYLDQALGTILDHLEASGLAGNTIVIFTTDHGHFLGQHGLIAKGPFPYQDGVRVPFIVRWPGRVPAGRASDALQSTVDLTPTLLAAAGLPVPDGLQGSNQLPCWRGSVDAVRDHVIVEYRYHPTKLHSRTYIDERYSLTVYQDRPYGVLFDLRNDPDEVANLWDEPTAAALRAELTHRALGYELRREPLRSRRVSIA